MLFGVGVCVGLSGRDTVTTADGNITANCVVTVKAAETHSGGDVYVAGYESNGSNDVAVVWKNGVASNLTDGAENVTAISLFVK